MAATLKFLADLPLYREEKPFTLYGFPEHVQPSTNCEFEIHNDIDVQDARYSRDNFSLHDAGFEFHCFPSHCSLKSQVFEDPEQRESVWRYLRETIDYTQRVFAASKVLCFDWRLRRSGATCGVVEQLDDLENARYRALSPAALMHCDYSFQGGLETLQIHLSPDEYQGIISGRVRAKIVNMWRPLAIVKVAPLVLCDRNTVSVDDVLETDQVAPTKVELSLTLIHRETQKYWWLSSQKPDEVTFFTSWDSQPSGKHSDHTPHGAWINESHVDNRYPPRESVEKDVDFYAKMAKLLAQIPSP